MPEPQQNPWDKYAAATPSGDGPWAKYGQQTQAPPAPQQQPSALNRFATSATGLPEGSHITGAATMEELKHPVDTAVKVAGSTLSGLNPWSGSGDAAQIGLRQMGQPGIGNKITGGVKYLESGIPFIGPSLVRAGGQIESKDYAGAAGSMIPPALSVAGMRGGGVTPESAGDFGAKVMEAPGKLREKIGGAIHDERTGKVTGAIPSMPAVLGQSVPKVLDTIFPEPEATRIGRMQTMARRIDPQETARAQKIQGLPKGTISPFGTLSSEPGNTPMLEPMNPVKQVGATSTTGPEVKMVSKIEPQKPSGIVAPDSPPPTQEGSYWSFKEEALRKAVLSGDRHAAIIYQTRFGTMPEGAKYLTDVGSKPTRGLYQNDK